MCTPAISVRGMAKKFTCRLMGFGFTEMAKFEVKYLSTGPQGFSGSQHNSQSQTPLTQQYSSSQHKTQSQKLLTEQHTERMELQNIKTLALPTTKNQLQGSQSESLVKTFSESEGFSELSNCTKQLEWDEVMRILEASSNEHITLSDEQKTVLEAVSRGQSVFVTGSAGTGKSYLLDFVVKILKEMHGPGSVFVTASTGIAACHLNGMTLHSFSGAPPFDTTKEKLLIMIERKEKNVNRWLKAKALIIDEINMIDGEFFDQLSYVANELRQPLNGKQVWGGLQLVVTGDFFQLQPVRPQNQDKFFAFQADCWNECFDKQIELTHIFRQSDRELVEMLQEIRRGQWDRNRVKLFNRHGSSVTKDESVTRLYPWNRHVMRVNEERLEALEQEIITFTAMDKGKVHAKIRLKSGIAPDQIGLCVGAQVMLIKNIETGIGLVKGATGQIVGFVEGVRSRAISPTQLWPKVRFLCGVERIITPETWSIYEGEVEVASRRQVPLILAWAVTVHKCQGMTLEKLETDLSRAFEFGMVYVAISRAKSLDGLRLTGSKPSKIKAHPSVLDFYKKLKGSLDDKGKK